MNYSTVKTGSFLVLRPASRARISPGIFCSGHSSPTWLHFEFGERPPFVQNIQGGIQVPVMVRMTLRTIPFPLGERQVGLDVPAPVTALARREEALDRF